MAIKFFRSRTDSSIPKDISISTTSSTSKLQISSGSSVRSQSSVRNSTPKDTPKKTTEELSKDIENVMREEVRKHVRKTLAASLRAPSPDTSIESSIFSASDYSSKDASFIFIRDGNGCRATDGFRGSDNASVNVRSFDLGTLDSSSSDSDSDSEVSSTPGKLGCVDWLADITPARGERPKQLDIYAKSPGSWTLRLYSKMPRPERTDHILVKVHVS
jgi:hypothetical protein